MGGEIVYIVTWLRLLNEKGGIYIICYIFCRVKMI